MTRLTNDARGRIVNMILAHKFDAIEHQFYADENAIALAAYEKLYPKAVREVMEQAESVRKGMFGEKRRIKINAGGWQRDWEFGKDGERFIVRPFTLDDYQKWPPLLDLTEDDKFGKKVREFMTREKEHKAEKEHLRGQVTGHVSAYWTFDKLSASWPEIDCFVRAVERNLERPIVLPALADHRALNAALDLPPETAA